MNIPAGMNTFLSRVVVLSLAAGSTLLAQNPPPVTAPPNPVDPAIVNELVGDWKNGLNSTLHIEAIDPATGKIDGSYISPQGTNGTAFPLVGWVNTKANRQGAFPVVVISWTVRFGTAGSITGWTGFYAALPKDGPTHTPTIVGQWNLGRVDGDYEWDHILAGQDRFLKVH